METKEGGDASDALLDRYKGGMLGMAVCDALGTTLEFQVLIVIV